MKLYKILFEQKGGNISYAPPDFALYTKQDGDETILGLLHIPSLEEFLKSGKPNTTNNDIYQFCAGMVVCRESTDGCLGAMQISVIASSPIWKGAGTSMYALASSYFGSPIISDRSHSDSIASKKAWAKIEASPEWKMAGIGLDNFAPTSPNKTYMDIQGTFPNRTATILDGPKTPEEIDDCPLPTKGGELSHPQAMQSVLGTANAYRYNGPLSAQPLVSNFQKVLPQLQELAGPNNIDINSLLTDSFVTLFKVRYKS